MASKAAWVRQLREAKFRNVPFKVDSHASEFGRRIVNHEFPGRDEPFAEDLGRKQRVFSVQGFIVGPNYFAARDALIAACEKEGAGELVHPYLGTKNVVVESLNVSETRTDGGFVTFTIGFREAGKKGQPLGTRDLKAGLNLSADAAARASTKAFEKKFSVFGAVNFVVDSASRNVRDLADFMQGSTAGVSGDPLGIARINSQINRLKATAGDLVRTPGGLSGSLRSVLSDLRNSLSLSGILQDTVSATRQKALDAQQSRRVLQTYDTLARFQKGAPLPTTQTESRQQEYDNTVALRRLVQTLALFEFARVAADATFATTAEAAAVRDNLYNSLDEQLDDAQSDEVFSAIQDVKQNVVVTIPDPTSETPRLSTVTLTEPLPSLVLVYDLYESAELEDDIVTRNRVRNPLFMPALTAVEVLAGV